MELNDNNTHTVTITVTGNYQHGQQKEQSSTRISGDGSLEHMILAFKTALIGSGFVEETVKGIFKD